jgi:2-polyprenyl-6-methoxyphenol hydroxylase-like FAD-dependent oxidoreductase
MIKSKSFAIVGGGIGGLTLAIALQKKGFSVKVYENAPEIKPVGAGIVLAANALKAYRAIGIEKEIMSAGREMKCFRLQDQKGNTLSKTEVSKIVAQYGTVSTLTLHRADLHQVLVRNLQPDTLILGKCCQSFEEKQNGITLNFKDGTSALTDFVVAADGIHSIFRKKLCPEVKLRYSGYTCWRGITATLPVGFNFEEASESWGAGKRFGIVPLSNGRVYWFATVNAPENDQEKDNLSVKDVETMFSEFHFPVKEIIANTNPVDMIKNDIIDIPPIKRFAFGRIVLLGDAAHATTPNLGQGACMAVEDAVVLANCLEISSEVVPAFQEYETRRVSRTTKIVNSSFQMGKVGQVANPLLVRLRDLAIRFTPESITDKQLRFLFDVTFS